MAAEVCSLSGHGEAALLDEDLHVGVVLAVEVVVGRFLFAALVEVVLEEGDGIAEVAARMRPRVAGRLVVVVAARRGGVLGVIHLAVGVHEDGGYVARLAGFQGWCHGIYEVAVAARHAADAGDGFEGTPHDIDVGVGVYDLFGHVLQGVGHLHGPHAQC